MDFAIIPDLEYNEVSNYEVNDNDRIYDCKRSRCKMEYFTQKSYHLVQRRRRKLYAANEIVRAIDSEAFVTITKIKEVRGRGFTTERRFANLEGTTE